MESRLARGDQGERVNNHTSGRLVVRDVRSVLLIFPLCGLALGFAAQGFGYTVLALVIWGVATVPVLGALLYEIAASFRRTGPGLDVVAALSMAGGLALKEPLAALVVALMYSGGRRLEELAQRRARRETESLLSRAPRFATRYTADRLEEIPISDVAVGDRLLVRRGEVVPVDGVVSSSRPCWMNWL